MTDVMKECFSTRRLSTSIRITRHLQGKKWMMTSHAAQQVYALSCTERSRMAHTLCSLSTWMITEHIISVQWEKLGLDASAAHAITNVMSGEDLGTHAGSFASGSLKPHQALYLRLTPQT